MLNRLLISVYLLSAASTNFAQQWEWVDYSNGNFIDISYTEDVAVDSVRDVVYAVGYVNDNPNFPEIPNSDFSGQDDGFLMKYDLNGNVQFGFLIGGTGNDRIQGVEVDESTGNVFVTGYITGSSADLSGALAGIPSSVSGNYGGQDAFIAMYNVFGQLVWYQLFGGTGLDRGLDVTVNSSAVFMTGVYTNTPGGSSFPTVIAANSAINNFIVALDKTNGSLIWDAALGSEVGDYDPPPANYEVVRTGITANDTDVFVVNYFFGTTYQVFDGADVLSASLSDANPSTHDFVVTSYSNSGAHNWSTLYDNINDQVRGLDITSDCGGVYVTGTMYDGSVTPGGTVISSSYDNPIISKLDKNSGSEIWVKEFNSVYALYDYFIGLKADGYGNLYAVGRLRGASLSSVGDFNFTGSANGQSEIMMAHYHTDGTYKSFEVISSSEYSWGVSVDIYKNEKYLLGGYYNNNISFGMISVPSASNSAFIGLRDITDPFNYVSAAGNESFCQDELTAIPSINNNTVAGGTFSGPSQVVFNDVNTGEIDLAASTPGGPYSIIYSGSPLTCTSNVSAFDLFIVASLPATFTYESTTFCNNGTNPTPTSITTPGGTFSAPSGLPLISSSTGEIDLIGSTPGTYWLIYTTAGSCPLSDSVEITITSAPDPSFSYISSTFCNTQSNPIPSTFSSGVFSAPAGLVINPTTGEIDLSASTIGGPYTIKHVVSNAFCADSSTFDVTIDQADDATFNYSASAFCQNEPNPTPTLTGTSGGIFSGPSGVSINSTTGEIDVAASTVGGPYWIVYTTSSSFCPDMDSVQVSIEDVPDPTFAYAQSSFCTGAGSVLPNVLATPGGIFTGPPEVVFLNSTTGEINLNTSTVGGPYTIQYTTPAMPCQATTTFSITIAPTEDASFSYGSFNFCVNESNPTPFSIATPGGSFSASTGLVVNLSTGEIDLAASTIGGPYWLMYTTPGITCLASDSIEVYIEDVPDATFGYDLSSYCESAGGSISPSFIFTTGGTFSAPAGVVIDALSGEIDLNASAAGGPYAIEYTVSNTYCQSTYSFDMTILEQDELISVEYLSSEFCFSDNSQIPTVNGASGIFTGPMSVDIVNASTGEINPSNSVVGGPYTIQYVTDGACPDSVEIDVSILDSVTSYAGGNIELFFVFSADLDADIPAIGSGQWSTSSGASILDPFDAGSSVSGLEIGENIFVWTVSNGACPAVSDEVTITVQDIFIPQAVTPNGDGKNDFFELISLEEATCDVKIFNRWGQIVYENSNYENEWYGQHVNGEELQNDTYFYTIIINDSLPYEGFVVLKK